MNCIHCHANIATMAYGLCDGCYHNPNINKRYRYQSTETIRVVEPTDSRDGAPHIYESKEVLLMTPNGLWATMITADRPHIDRYCWADPIVSPQQSPQADDALITQADLDRFESEGGRPGEPGELYIGMDPASGESTSVHVIFDPLTGLIMTNPPQNHPLRFMDGVSEDDYTQAFFPAFIHNDKQYVVQSHTVTHEQLSDMIHKYGRQLVVYSCQRLAGLKNRGLLTVDYVIIPDISVAANSEVVGNRTPLDHGHWRGHLIR